MKNRNRYITQLKDTSKFMADIKAYHIATHSKDSIEQYKTFFEYSFKDYTSIAHNKLKIMKQKNLDTIRIKTQLLEIILSKHTLTEFKQTLLNEGWIEVPNKFLEKDTLYEKGTRLITVYKSKFSGNVYVYHVIDLQKEKLLNELMSAI